MKVNASDIDVDNEFVKFDMVFKGVEGEDGFSIMSHGTSDDPQGLLIDSIKINEWVACEPHRGETLFAENFDEARVATFDSNGVTVSADINLAAAGWTGESGHGIGIGAGTEVGISEALSSLKATSGTQYLDTQNTPGNVDISHTFTDTTAAVNGKTAVLSFDIGRMALNWNGTDFATDSDAKFEFRVDGHTVAEFDAVDFASANVLQHFDVDIMATDYNASNTHTLELIDTTDASHTNYFGFAVDSIKVSDWVV